MISGLQPKTREQKHGFLQFSKKLDYGLFLLIELARKTGKYPLSLQKVAQENGMSFFFLQKVAFELRKSGIVESNRGKNGGYILAKPASVITLKDIVEVLEGPVNVMHCLMTENSNCMRQPRCQMRHGLGAVNQAILNIFTQTTLDHLLQPTWKQPA
jgi:Rrf2 family protein